MNNQQHDLASKTQLKNTSKKKPLQAVAAGFIILGLYLLPWFASSTGASEEPNKKSQQSIPVVVSQLKKKLFEKRIITQGNVAAKNMTMVSPRIPGTLEKIFIDIGDPVVAGQTLLFMTDNIKLEQNVVIQRHALAVAKCGRQQALANQEKVKADLDKAKLDFDRFQRLLDNGNTTQNAFEQQQSRYLQISAGYKLTTAQVALASEQVRQAEAALAIAQKDLSDTKVLAPINGVISKRFKEPGEMGQPGKAVVSIVDVSAIEISAYLPAEYYPDVIIDKTELKVGVSGRDLGPQKITRKSPIINPKLRTFEIKSLLKNLPKGIAPGAMADVTVVLSQHEAIGVPEQAVQTRGKKFVVFVVEKDTARMVPVNIGLNMDGWVEILPGDLTLSQSIVTMGQRQLDNGSPVVVQKGGN